MSLLVNKYTYQPLSRVNSNGTRLYETPDGNKLASVTSVLDKTKPEASRIALAKWRKSVGEQKAQEITTTAANRGTRMHKILEDYIAGIPLNETITNPYAIESLKMAKVVIEQGLSNVDEVWGSEVPLYYPELYAGTTDCVGIHQGEPAILDFKQSNKPKKYEYIEDYRLQLCAYAACHNKVYGTNIRKGVILMCVKPPETAPGVWGEPQYQEFVLEGDEFDRHTDLWWDRVAQYYL